MRVKLNPEHMKKMLQVRWSRDSYLNNEQWVRQTFEKFKASRLSLSAFAKMTHHSESKLAKAFRRFMGPEYEAIIEENLSHNKRYLKGRYFEYRVRDYLTRKGYFVLRSPRSLGPVDLVAIRKGEVLLLQCKSHARPSLPSDEKAKLISLAESIGATPVLACREIQPPSFPLKFLNLIEGKELGI
jgi:Holliday junction resolvase